MSIVITVYMYYIHSKAATLCVLLKESDKCSSPEVGMELLRDRALLPREHIAAFLETLESRQELRSGILLMSS